MGQSFALAQVNVAQLKHPQGHPEVAAFFDNIDRINALADADPGLIWRSQEDYGNEYRVFNLSVWKDFDSLSGFVYRSDHVHIMRRKQEWMTPLTTAHSALWWIPVDHRPSAQEGIDKLAQLDANGPSADAFTFAQRFEAPSS